MVLRLGIFGLCVLMINNSPVHDPLTEVLPPIAEAVRDVCPEESPTVCDPVLVDVASFREALAPLGSHVTAEGIGAGLGYRVRDVPTDSVYVCEPGREIYQCDSKNTGVHVRVRSIPAGRDTLVLESMLGWTGRSGTFSSGFSLVRYLYTRENGRWVFREERPRVVT